jgi:hypothetical protein
MGQVAFLVGDHFRVAGVGAPHKPASRKTRDHKLVVEGVCR